MRNFSFFLAAIFLFIPGSIRARSEPLERNDSERQLFELLNSERTAQGLSALQWDGALFKAARQHALQMANLNLLEHQLPSEPKLEERLAETGARFGVIAENIAFGGSPQTIHAGWMKSPGHRKNILDPRLTSVGIAAVRGTGGYFAVQDFSQAVANLSAEQQEEQVIVLLKASGFRSAKAGDDARKTCASDAGMVGSSAREMIRFETADLSKLPEEVERKIRGAAFSRAAVGACGAKDATGFVRYRIAVLFF